MASRNQAFFALRSFAVVSNTDLGPFPGALYDELAELDKDVYPVDLGGSRYVRGDEAFALLRLVPKRVEGVIVELPRHRVVDVIEEMVLLDWKQLWVQGSASQPVQLRCKEHGIELHQGDARAYTRPGFSWSKLLLKLSGGY